MDIGPRCRPCVPSGPPSPYLGSPKLNPALIDFSSTRTFFFAFAHSPPPMTTTSYVPDMTGCGYAGAKYKVREMDLYGHPSRSFAEDTISGSYLVANNEAPKVPPISRRSTYFEADHLT
ncbi:hypothetical protein A0H81_02548 [Grifola frondosa]|uniref:Uncharacterized protein n=1 Tax=Grifola frondosa TaxID=5627 RepID=A0A1C7ML95_GRIFR|nr:hypothetical protein A0H81_02548 [Grifola frondosa]